METTREELEEFAAYIDPDGDNPGLICRAVRDAMGTGDAEAELQAFREATACGDAATCRHLWKPVKERAERAEAEAASLRTRLRHLEEAGRAYRWHHDVNGDGSLQAGRAWDRMRREGDSAREALHPTDTHVSADVSAPMAERDLGYAAGVRAGWNHGYARGSADGWNELAEIVGEPVEKRAQPSDEIVRSSERMRTDARQATDPAPASEPERLYVVFDGPPGPQPGRFVEVENQRGESVRAGEWEEHGGLWYLGPLYRAAPAPTPDMWCKGCQQYVWSRDVEDGMHGAMCGPVHRWQPTVSQARKVLADSAHGDSGVFLCAKCGHGSEEHGMPTHPAYKCVADMRLQEPADPAPADRPDDPHKAMFLELVMAFQERAHEFMSEDGEGGFVAVIHRMADEIERLRSDRPEPSEALAELDELKRRADRGASYAVYDTDEYTAVHLSYMAVRQSLSQPVPAVPDAVRRLPDKWRTKHMVNADKGRGLQLAAEELDAALAAAPTPAGEQPAPVVVPL